MDQSRTRDWLNGALLLSIAGLIAKLLSAVYKVPYQNITGDVGFYVYQQVYPFYGIALTLATYGLPIVIAKQYAEKKTTYDEDHANNIARLSFMIILMISVLMWLLIWTLAPNIAGWMGDEHLLTPIRAISLCFLTLPFLSVGRGVLQGAERLKAVAVAQVAEQFVRVLLILLLSAWLMNVYGPYMAGTGAVVATLLAGLTAVFILAISLRRHIGSIGNMKRFSNVSTFSLGQVLKVMKDAFFISASALCLILLQLVDAISVPRLLQASGMVTEEAASVKGTYDRAWPMIQFATVAVNALALSLVPLVAKAYQRGERVKLENYTTKTLKVVFLVAVAASIGMAIIMEPFNMMLFTNTEATLALKIMAFSGLFGSLFIAVAGILQGMDQSRFAAQCMVVGLVVKLILNMTLVPLVGIIGASIATVAATITMSLCGFMILYQNNKFQWPTWSQVLSSTKALVVMVFATYLWLESWKLIVGEFTRLNASFLAISAAIVGAFIYIVVLNKSELIQEEEREMLPGYSKIERALNIRRKGDE
ncbi:putative polysaccharide biosynthesis protein [Texcoconibacillus texcoconensis]|uniref:PST family polysaccharide transporter n=1 Tax=Texcoconibacillus texcoconensis TaxID=1095777 RepID=A0A840QUE4_9BACI|nr:polysaccharide biosynthesis protein [Texcoconibacillus texcoconensis]MBB5174901.1 PST family polysaccharide transporter [Texcoconibacillus texcoconensis]